MIKAIRVKKLRYPITKSIFGFDHVKRIKRVLKYTHVLLVFVVLDPNGMGLPFLAIIF